MKAVSQKSVRYPSDVPPPPNKRERCSAFSPLLVVPAPSLPPPAAALCCSFITNMNRSCDCCEIVGCIEWVTAILLITILPVTAEFWLHSCSSL